MNEEPPIEAIEEAVIQAQNEGNAWKADSFEVLLRMMQQVGVDDPVATRAKLTEMWVEGKSILALAGPTAYLRIGKWHARRGISAGEPALVVLVIVDEVTRADFRGRPPNQWPMQ
jgi:hypothetical protein